MLFFVQQFAERYPGDFCANEEALPEYMKVPITFTTEVNVGKLQSGAYKFYYLKKDIGLSSRLITVSRATTINIDSLPYAPVTNATTLEVINTEMDIYVTLNGVLNSSCVEVNDEITVQRGDDVFILLPTVKIHTGIGCLQMLLPFQRVVNLGKAAPGHYLVQVRSMSGKSVNRVVRVLSK
jgi:hypothetical protein